MDLHLLTRSSCDVNMPEGVNQKIGTNHEVREAFKDWDPRYVTPCPIAPFSEL